jgi:FlaA1/EpsC-like NDP-sugar epimerase
VINRHRLWQVVADAALVVAAWYLAFRLRFDGPRIPPYYEDLLWLSLPIVVVVQLGIFVLFGFYNRWWRRLGARRMESSVRVRGLPRLSLVVYRAPVEQIRLPRSSRSWMAALMAFVAGSRQRALLGVPRADPWWPGRVIVGAGDAGSHRRRCSA